MLSDTVAIREPREFAAGLLVLPAGARVIPRGSHRMRPEEVFPEGTVGSPLDAAPDPAPQISRPGVSKMRLLLAHFGLLSPAKGIPGKKT